MRDIHDKISIFVQDHLPAIYREEGDSFVRFVESYFEFLQEHNQTLEVARNLLEQRDVDSATDEFITHFRKKYLHNFPNIVDYNDADLIKHIQDIYKSKGSSQSIEAMMRILYNDEVKLNYPGEYVLRPSTAKFIRPRYLELEPRENNYNLIGKEVTGLVSSAKAFIENIARINSIDSRIIDIAFLSNVRGIFQTNEIIVDSTGIISGAPRISGSLTTLDIINGGANFNIGDEFDVISSRGFRGKARVRATVDNTGRVAFELIDGGSGYTLSSVTLSNGAPVTEVIISNNVIVPAYTENANNTPLEPGFFYANGDPASNTIINRFDTIRFPYAKVVLNEPSSEFDVGDIVEMYDVTDTVIANTFVVAKTSDANTLILSVESNTTNFTSTSYIVNPNDTSANGLIQTVVADVSVTANVTGSNATAFGVHGYRGGNQVYANNSYFHLLDEQTGLVKATGRVSNVSSGSGATFEIGSLTATEQLAFYTDLLAGVNNEGTQYVDPFYNASGLTVEGGLNSTGTIALSGLAPYDELQVANTFQDVYIQDGGTGYSVSDTITINNNNYANGSAILGHSAGTGLSIAINAVDANGAITQASLVDGGSDYVYIPEITISGGSDAVLIPLMGYGFPKFPSGNLDTTIADCIEIINDEIGTIRTISGINPGAGYNFDPFVVVINPYLAAYDRRDLIISGTLTSDVPLLVGEEIQQPIYVTLSTLTLGSAVNPVNFSIGEGIRDAANSANFGVVTAYDSVSGILEVEVIGGTFDNIAIGANTVLGITTTAEWDVTSVTSTTAVTAYAKGIVSDWEQQFPSAVYSEFNGTPIVVKVDRRSFNTGFAIEGTLTGFKSGATMSIDTIIQDPDSRPMGDDSVFTARATQADNIVDQLEIVDSGIGYVDGERVTLQLETNPIIVTATTRLGTAGQQQGFWREDKHFVSSTESIIQDNDFYQDFSYVIKTGISFEKYEQALKELVHVAGSKMFGEVVKILEINEVITVPSSAMGTEFEFQTNGQVSAACTEIRLEPGAVNSLSEDMVVVGTWPGSSQSVYTVNVVGANLTANTFVVDDVDNLYPSTRNFDGGLQTELSGWYNGMEVVINGKTAGGTVITDIDRSSNTISIQNDLLSSITDGTEVNFYGTGSLSSNTRIVSINNDEDLITITTAPASSIPDGTLLTFKGQT